MFFRLKEKALWPFLSHICLPSQLVSFIFQQEVVSQAASHDWPIIALPGPTYHPPTRASWRPGTSCLCREMNLGLQHSLHLPPRESWPVWWRGRGLQEPLRLGDTGLGQDLEEALAFKTHGWPWLCNSLFALL